MHFLNLAAWFDQWWESWDWWFYLSFVAASGDFSRRNVVLTLLNGFVWSDAISAPRKLFLVSCFENLDPAQKVSLRIPMDGEISIHLFCHSLGSRLPVRLLLRLMRALLKYGLSGHAARGCRLGWFRNVSDRAILLMRFLLRVGYVENAAVWLGPQRFGRSFRPGKPSNSPRWCAGRHDGAEGAISTNQYTCLQWAVNEAFTVNKIK